MNCGRIGVLFDACSKKFQNVSIAKRKSFASVSKVFLRTLFGLTAIFVRVYEPKKQKLLKMFPENLSALAHFAKSELNNPENAIIGAFAASSSSSSVDHWCTFIFVVFIISIHIRVECNLHLTCHL